MKLFMYLFYPNLKKRKNVDALACTHAAFIRFSRAAQTLSGKSMEENFRTLAHVGLPWWSLPPPPPPSLISSHLKRFAKTVRRVSSTDGSLSSQFKRAVFPFNEEMDRLVQKAETSKTLHPCPLRARSRVVSCVPLFRRRRAGPIIGGESSFFSFCAPPTCHPVQSRLPLSFAATESLPEALCCVYC